MISFSTSSSTVAYKIGTVSKAVAGLSLVGTVALAALATTHILPWHLAVIPAATFVVSTGGAIGIHLLTTASKVKKQLPIPPSATPPLITSSTPPPKETSPEPEPEPVIPEPEPIRPNYSFTEEDLQALAESTLTNYSTQGMQQTATDSTILKYFACQLFDFDKKNKLTKELETAIQLDELIKDGKITEAKEIISEKIKNNEPVLIYGGWEADSTNNPILYSLIPSGDTITATLFSFFDTTSSTSPTMETYAQQSRVLQLPSVTKELFGQSLFLDCLLELHTPNASLPNPPSTEMITRAWPSQEPLSLLHSGTYQGNKAHCAKTLMAWISYRMDKDHTGHKQSAPSREFKWSLKNTLLDEYFKLPKEKLNAAWSKDILNKVTASLAKREEKTGLAKEKKEAWNSKIVAWRQEIAKIPSTPPTALRQGLPDYVGSSRLVSPSYFSPPNYLSSADGSSDISNSATASSTSLLPPRHDHAPIDYNYWNAFAARYENLKQALDQEKATPEARLIATIRFLDLLPGYIRNTQIFHSSKPDLESYSKAFQAIRSATLDSLSLMETLGEEFTLPPELFAVFLRSWSVSCTLAEKTKLAPWEFIREQEGYVRAAFQQMPPHATFLNPYSLSQIEYVGYSQGHDLPLRPLKDGSTLLFNRSVPKEAPSLNAEEKFLWEMVKAGALSNEEAEKLSTQEKLALLYGKTAEDLPKNLDFVAYDTVRTLTFALYSMSCHRKYDTSATKLPPLAFKSTINKEEPGYSGPKYYVQAGGEITHQKNPSPIKTPPSSARSFNAILADHAQDPIMLTRALTRLHPHLALTEWIALFTKNPLLLKDPEYQKNFFADQALLLEAAKNPYQREQLFTFLEKSYEGAHLAQDPAWYGITFQIHLTFVAYVSYDHDVVPRLEQKKILESFQKKCHFFQEEKSALSQEVLYALSAVAMQAAQLYDTSYDVPSQRSNINRINHFILKEIAPHLIALRLHQIRSSTGSIPLPFISPTNVQYGATALTAFLLNMKKEEAEKFTESLSTITKQPCVLKKDEAKIQMGMAHYNLIDGSFEGDTSTHTASTHLPLLLTQHKDFIALFGRDTHFIVKEQKDNQWHFYGPKGEVYTAYWQSPDTLHVQRTLKNTIYTFDPHNALLPDAHPLSSTKAHHWRHEQSVWIEDAQGVPKAYTNLVGDSLTHALVKLSKSGQTKPGPLCLIKSLPEKLKPLLTAIEQENQILAWGDENGYVKEIELPRLRLKFLVTNENGSVQLRIKGDADFYLSTYPLIEVQGVTGCLLLTNGRGSSKVLIPKRFADPASITAYQPIQRAQDSLFSEFYSYSFLTRGDSIEPHEKRKENLFLSYLYITNRNYKKAIRVFDLATFHQSPFSEEEKEILLHMLSTESGNAPDSVDQHPLAVSLRLKVALALRPTESLSTPKIQEAQRERYYQDLSTYFSRIHHVMRFDQETEKQLFQDLATYKPAPTPTIPTPTSPSSIAENLLQHILSQSSLAPIPELLSPGEAFFHNFLLYYTTAYEGALEEKQDLRQRLTLYHIHPDSEIKKWSRALLWVMDHRDQALHPDVFKQQTLNKGETFTQWLSTHENYSLPSPEIKQSPATGKDLSKKQPLPSALASGMLPAPAPSSLLEKLSSPQTSLTCTAPDAKNDLNIPIQLKAIFDPAITQEAVIQREFTRIQTGITEKEAQLQQAQQRTIIDPQQIRSVTSQLENTKRFLQREKEPLAKTIVENFNRVALEDESFLKVLAEQQAPLTLNEILMLFGLNNDALFSQANPSIKNLNRLKEDVRQYLITSTELAQIERALSLTKNYPKTIGTTNQEKTIEDQFYQLLAAKRTFPPDQHPQLLVYEYFSGYYIREDQIHKLSQLGQQGLLEAYTGFGKSKVIIPCWLATSAIPGKLAGTVVPEKLFQEMETNLHQSMRRFQKQIVSIRFDRQQPNRDIAIQTILKQLKDAQAKGHGLLMTDKTLHNLINLYPKELLSEGKANSAAFTACMEIRSLLKQGAFFFEEPHITLNDVFEFNWSIGKPDAISIEKINVIYKIYDILISDRSFHPLLARFSQTSNKMVTEQEYHTTFKGQLAKTLSNNNQALENYYSGKPPQGFTPSAEQRTIRNQLNHYLPLTLTQGRNEKYGIHDVQTNRLAIPGTAVGNLEAGAEFSTKDEQINFTIQANLADSFSQEEVDKVLNTLTVQSSIEAPKGITDTEKLFTVLLEQLELKDMDLHKLSTEDKKRICEQLNNSLKGKLFWTAQFILPAIDVYTEKVKSSPHLLVQSLGKVVGASATLGQQNLPIEAEEDPTSPIDTLLQLLHSHATAPIEIIRGSSTEKFLDNLLQSKDFQAFIDIGGCCGDLPNGEDVAKLILEKTKTWTHAAPTGVLFFRGDGEPWVLLRGTAKSVPLEKLNPTQRANLFYYFGQTYITGVDINLPPNCVAKASCHGDSQLTNAIQGVGRLRALKTGQKCTFVIPEKEESSIRETLKNTQSRLFIGDLLKFFTIQQGKKRGHINFASLQLQWEAIAEKKFWEFAEKNTNDPQAIQEHFQKMRDLLIEPIQDVSTKEDIATQKRPVTEVVEEMKNDFLQTKAASVAQEVEADVKKTIDTSRLPSEVIATDAHAAIQITQAITQATTHNIVTQLAVNATQHETQQRVQQAYALQSSELELHYKPFEPKEKEDYICWEKQKTLNEALDTHGLFDKTLTVSPNFLAIAKEEGQDASLYHDRLKPVQYCHVKLSAKGRIERFTLIDHQDTQHLKDYFHCKQTNLNLREKWEWHLADENEFLLSLASDETVDKAFHSSNFDQKTIQNDPLFPTLRMQAKVLNGDFALSDSDWSLFETWAQQNKAEWIKIYPHILKARPNALTRLSPQRQTFLSALTH